MVMWSKVSRPLQIVNEALLGVMITYAALK